MKELYTKEVMAFAANIPLLGALAQPDGGGEAHSKLCGSMIEVSLKLRDGRVSEFGQEVKACLVGQASASMLAGKVLGLTRGEVEQGRELVRAMLQDEAALADESWSDYALLEPVRNYPSRIATVLLPFDACLRAFDTAEMADTHQQEAEHA